MSKYCRKLQQQCSYQSGDNSHIQAHTKQAARRSTDAQLQLGRKQTQTTCYCLKTYCSWNLTNAKKYYICRQVNVNITIKHSKFPQKGDTT